MSEQSELYTKTGGVPRHIFFSELLIFGDFSD
jgi:hypothetical protein